MINVSGQSYNDGIKFIGEKYSVTFKEERGKTTITVGENVLKDTNKVVRFIKKLPLVRGFFNIVCKNFLLLAILITDVIINLIPVEAETTLSERTTMLLDILSLVTFVIMVGFCAYLISKMFMKMKTTWMYHGAEHKVIETNYQNKEITLENCRQAPRVSDNCGTMLVSLMIFVGIILNVLQMVFRIHLWGSIELILTITLAYELFRLKRTTFILKPAFKLGYFLQEKLFTKEPNDHQLAQAMLAFSILEGLETNELTLKDVDEVLSEANKY